MDFFLDGYNCSQAVVLAFDDLTGLDTGTLLRLSGSFGAGMGRLREVCGAFSGILIILGLLYGYEDPHGQNEKMLHYQRIQQLAGTFTEKRGTLICRELLGLPPGPDSYIPSQRTETFYLSRPCKEIIGDAAEILDRYITEHPPEKAGKGTV